MKNFAIIFAMASTLSASFAFAGADSKYEYKGDTVVCSVSESESYCFGDVVLVDDETDIQQVVCEKKSNGKCPSADVCAEDPTSFRVVTRALAMYSGSNPEACNKFKPAQNPPPAPPTPPQNPPPVRNGGGGR